MFTAQLLFSRCGYSREETHHHFCFPPNSPRRGINLRLQVPDRRREDFVSLLVETVSKISQLNRSGTLRKVFLLSCDVLKRPIFAHLLVVPFKVVFCFNPEHRRAFRKPFPTSAHVCGTLQLFSSIQFALAHARSPTVPHSNNAFTLVCCLVCILVHHI